MSAERIDVLAVMDTDIAEHEQRIMRGELPLTAYDQVNAKREAHAAVAELIEAAKLARSYMAHVEWCSEVASGIDGDCPCGHNLHLELLDRAFARCGGAS